MLTNTVLVSFSAGHRLMNHPGKCRRLHGHNYIAEVSVRFDSRALHHSVGYVIDFGDLKKAVKNFIDNEWDHRMVLQESDPFVPIMRERESESLAVLPLAPTAETMARVLCGVTIDTLKTQGLADSVYNVSVTVHETPTCSATEELAI